MDKRFEHTKRSFFFGLSGGYDSGVISCYLSKTNKQEQLV